MFKKEDLYKIAEPNLIFTEMEKGKFDDLLNAHRLDEDRRNAVILLRGSKMKSVDDLFCEFASALQFPSYFGENWNALNDCLNDLSWLPADCYIIGINDSQDLLVDEKEEIDTLFKILNRACLEWSIPGDLGTEWEREGKPFHFLLQYSEQDKENVKAHLGKYFK